MPGQQDYARRLGADHIVLRRPVIKSSSPFYEIFQIHRLFEDYGRILYLDIDVLVRDDCPDLFARVPHNALGVFMESRLVDRTAEIRHIQTLWPALNWTEDYFNNGVMVTSRLHRDLFRPEAGLPVGLRFSDQTVMNYRAAALRLRLYDIGFDLNYMPTILPRGPVFRFCHSLVGPAIWPVPYIYQASPEPQSARVVHGAGFSYRLKRRLAERTFALWKHRRRTGFTAAHRRLNRVWGGLVPRMRDGVTLEEGEGSVLVRPSGGGRPLAEVEAETIRQCDGTRTSAQIVSSIYAAFPDHAPGRLARSVRCSLNAFLDDGYLRATNQIEPLFSRVAEQDGAANAGRRDKRAPHC